MTYEAAYALHEPAPLPTRLRNWFAVLAIAWGLITQLPHTHSTSFLVLKAGTHAVLTASDQNPDTCPLCAAMHSAKPAQNLSTAVIAVISAEVIPPFGKRVILFPPTYLHFSRPPPRSSR